MPSKDELKRQAAEQALQYITDDITLGVGTGSTVNIFIDLLASVKNKINCAVSSSKQSEQRLKEIGIPVYDLNAVDDVPLYVDGADEVNDYLCLTKGGGGALTREKIIATAAKKFVCIVDESKIVHRLGKFPLPIEVIPMARSYVARQIVKLGGDPVYRDGFVTDNGNIILDIHNLDISQPIKLEQTINNITGVVCNGIFAQRSADVVLVASSDGVRTMTSNLSG